MPISCDSSVLTGSNGTVAITPAGTSVCLRDFTDFPAGDNVTVPSGHGFLVGDQVVFTVEDGASLDGALTAGDEYFVIAKTDTTLQVSSTKGGAAVTLDGDGGTNGADTPLPAHINLALSEFLTVCHVSSFSLNLDRGQIETTSLSCDPCSDTGGGGLAPFKTYQPGYIDGTGTIEVQFTSGQENASSRLLGSSIKKDQSGAQVKLYINTVCSGGEIDDTASGYIEAPVTILGFSFSVTPDEVTTASVNFALSGQPTTFQI